MITFDDDDDNDIMISMINWVNFSGEPCFKISL